MPLVEKPPKSVILRAAPVLLLVPEISGFTNLMSSHFKWHLIHFPKKFTKFPVQDKTYLIINDGPERSFYASPTSSLLLSFDHSLSLSRSFLNTPCHSFTLYLWLSSLQPWELQDGL